MSRSTPYLSLANGITPGLSCIEWHAKLMTGERFTLPFLPCCASNGGRRKNLREEAAYCNCEYALPYISRSRRYGALSNEIKFKILRRHLDVRDYPLLFIAETLNKDQIIVKFTRRYSIELQAFCADQGRACVDPS
jgi:hypothetical protein